MASSFDAAFGSCLDANYQTMGVAGVWTTAAGVASAVTLVVDDIRSETTDRPGHRSTTRTLTGSVRVSEVASVSRGDTVKLSNEATVYKIQPASVTRDGLEINFQAIADQLQDVGHVEAFPDR
jgi:hypothetical protein